jgi:DNA-binding transcriptional MerR regulator
MDDYIIKNVTKLAKEINAEINSDKRRSIGEVAKELAVEAHVIRFWESKFEQIKPEIGRGKRRYYRKKDIELLRKIKNSLYDQGYTIAGLQKLIKNKQNRQKQKSDTDSSLTSIAKSLAKKNKNPFDEEDDYNDNNQDQIKIEDFIDQAQPAKTEINYQNIDQEEILMITNKIQKNLAKLKSLI